jgi:hypothetical protein
MSLNDQITPHTLLKPRKENQPQNHLSASYPCKYDGNFYYANEEINSNYVKPIYDTFVFDDGAYDWLIQID